MATITLELPDELAARLRLEPARWPGFVREAVESKLAQLSSAATTPRPLAQELVDFLATQPEMGQIAAFKISAQAQDRLEELLDKNRETALTAPEQAELDRYFQYRHALILLKASARCVLDAHPA